MAKRLTQPRVLPDPPKRPTRWASGEWWEWLLIFVAMAAMWPKILHLPGIHWDLILWSALGLMVWVFVRRMKRFKQEWKKDD